MGKKYFCIQIHTERLHDDGIWEEVQKILEYFAKRRIYATWFSINPAFVGYRAMDFTEDKWKKRLRVISAHEQDIQQHTHFYKGKEGVPKGDGYDLSEKHMRKRLLEDKAWLEKLGFKIRGFVSGAWYVNENLFRLLYDLSFKYDSSTKSRIMRDRHGILEIPVSTKTRQLLKHMLMFRIGRAFVAQNENKICVISFHDYDLGSFRFRFALKLIVWIFKWMKFDFVNTKTLYNELSFKKA